MGDENTKGLNMFVELYINGIPVSQLGVVNMYIDDNHQCVMIVENELTKARLSDYRNELTKECFYDA